MDGKKAGTDFCIMRDMSTQPKLSFMSANFLGREKGYQEVRGFGEGNLSIREFYEPVETYGERIDGLFADIAALGFKGVDLWTAHCNPAWATEKHYEGVREASARHGVEMVSLAGGTGASLEHFENVCRLAKGIGCSLLGLGSALLPEQIQDVQNMLEKYDLHLAFENHPNEPTPESVVEKIGHGAFDRVRVTLDTGWFGTHGYPVEKAIDTLLPFIRLVHLKNIVSSGEHEAAAWDTGCLDMLAIVRHLRDVGYSDWISLEYEPLEHDPSMTCVRFKEAVEGVWNDKKGSAD